MTTSGFCCECQRKIENVYFVDVLDDYVCTGCLIKGYIKGGDDQEEIVRLRGELKVVFELLEDVDSSIHEWLIKHGHHDKTMVLLLEQVKQWIDKHGEFRF